LDVNGIKNLNIELGVEEKGQNYCKNNVFYMVKNELIFKKWGWGAWIGLSWLRIATGGGLLWMR
jgi:hypothetical protein